MYKILIVEDDRVISEEVAKHLMKKIQQLFYILLLFQGKEYKNPELLDQIMYYSLTLYFGYL